MVITNCYKFSGVVQHNLTVFLFLEVRSPDGLWVLGLGSLKAEIKVLARCSMLVAGGGLGVPLSQCPEPSPSPQRCFPNKPKAAPLKESCEETHLFHRARTSRV